MNRHERRHPKPLQILWPKWHAMSDLLWALLERSGVQDDVTSEAEAIAARLVQ